MKKSPEPPSFEESLVSRDFVFKRDESGKLSFVGDFEGLYQSMADPWGQSGSDARLAEYYAYSRNNLLKVLSSGLLPRAPRILEVGCGLGYVANMLRENVAGSSVTGMDISATAVEKAKGRFGEIDFIVADITAPSLKLECRFDAVIVDQILWYVLDGLKEMFDNVHALLDDRGIAVVVNAFLDDQQYGKDIVDGFDGLVQYVSRNLLGKRFNLVKAKADYVNAFIHRDGIVVLRKAPA